jgi:hypothetical protein
MNTTPTSAIPIFTVTETRMLAIFILLRLVEINNVNNFRQLFSYNQDHCMFKYVTFVQSEMNDRRRKVVFNNHKRFRKCNSHGKSIFVTGRGGP